jgi:hypothetical protein
VASSARLARDFVLGVLVGPIAIEVKTYAGAPTNER